MARQLNYELIPRYSGGSPAAVSDRKQAERVAEQEKRAYQAALEGFYGEESAREAKRLGLGGIVLRAVMSPDGKRHDTAWEDLITGEMYLDVPLKAFRVDPETVVEWHTGTKIRYYFRRKLVYERRGAGWGGKLAAQDMLRVLAAIPDFPVHSVQAYNLWERRVAA